MEILVTDRPVAEVEADALLVGVQGDTVDPVLDQALGGVLSETISQSDFDLLKDEVVVLYSRVKDAADSGLAVGRVLVVAVDEEPTLESLREATAKGAKKAEKLGVTRLATTLAQTVPAGYNPTQAAAAVAEGAVLATYRYEELKTATKKEQAALASLILVLGDQVAGSAARVGADYARAVTRGVTLARDLVNAPGNVATPTALAERAHAIAEHAPFIKTTVYDRAQARELGMGAFLAVAQGSAEEPRFIVLEHRLDEFPDQPPVVLVGKGITFDSGGISIKPAQGLHEMKDDMSGGAAVIGTFAALAEMTVPLPVVGLVPATENMLDANSFRPGDVMTNMSGKTIENQNSDAEGRLILSDALAYAERYHPRAIVDLATLTGAMVVALGQGLIGAFSTDPELLDRIEQAGETTGEPLWEMPLYEPYAKFLESDVADIRNIGPRWGGAITAALFLKYFVPEGVPWAHLDIAGVAWNHRERRPKPAYLTPGATGAGVRLLIEFLQSYLRP